MMKHIETLIWEHGEDMPQPNVLLQSKIVVHTTVWITVRSKYHQIETLTVMTRNRWNLAVTWWHCAHSNFQEAGLGACCVHNEMKRFYVTILHLGQVRSSSILPKNPAFLSAFDGSRWCIHLPPFSCTFLLGNPSFPKTAKGTHCLANDCDYAFVQRNSLEKSFGKSMEIQVSGSISQRKLLPEQWPTRIHKKHLWLYGYLWAPELFSKHQNLIFPLSTVLL